MIRRHAAYVGREYTTEGANAVLIPYPVSVKTGRNGALYGSATREDSSRRGGSSMEGTTSGCMSVQDNDVKLVCAEQEMNSRTQFNFVATERPVVTPPSLFSPN